MSGIRCILVAHDFSAHARAALAQAIALGKTFGAEVHVVHVVQAPVELLAPSALTVPEEVQREIQGAARRELEPALAEVRRAGLRGDVHLRQGDPSQALADEARRLGADLLVIGTRGNTGWKHVVLGSVAERACRIAPCAVLSVKAPEARRA